MFSLTDHLTFVKSLHYTTTILFVKGCFYNYIKNEFGSQGETNFAPQ